MRPVTPTRHRRPPSLPLLLVTLLVALLTALALTASPAPAASDEWTPAREGVWPLQPRPQVVEGFDPPEVRWGAGHRGVDLAGWPGAPVRAALGGTITFAAPLAGRGVVVVDHGPVRTTYQPVQTSLLVGERVERGQVVGTLVRSGSHCFPGSCLHWGLRRGETYLDPLLLVGGGPVRLLPFLSEAGGSAVARGPGRAV